MNAYHIIDTSPKVSLGDSYLPYDFDILCQIISALSWQRHNGKIGLVADENAINALGKLTKIYDKVLPLPEMNGIDNIAFWAGGKIFALGELTAPCAVIDTDFIVWEHLALKDGVTVAHREPINPFVYPNFDAFKMDDGYEFNPKWNWAEEPCNTAFMYFSDNDFKNYYVEQSKEFMKNAHNCDSVLTYMVFAEQRMLAMCAKEQGVAVNALMDYEHLGEDKRFTHLWGYKQVLKENKTEHDAFCKRCAARIEKDFPEYVEILKHSPLISEFFE